MWREPGKPAVIPEPQTSSGSSGSTGLPACTLATEGPEFNWTSAYQISAGDL